jgi:hypothetical protein
MNFYRVQIGKNTKRGGFNEMHSFVCQDESKRVYAIQEHFNKIYEGFDINVTPVVSIVKTNIENNNKLSSELKDAIKEINALKRKIGDSSSVYNGSLWSGNFDKHSKSLYKEYKVKLDEAKLIKIECREYLLEKLRRDNESICSSIEFVSFEDSYFKYKMRLNGSLVKE